MTTKEGIALLLIAGVFALMPRTVGAVEYGGFGGRPAFPREDNPRTESIFVHTLTPGEVQDEGVLVVNNTGEEKTLIVYGADSTPSTDGAFACKQYAESKLDVGAWIVLDKNEVTLASGTSEVVPFTISVPLSASVGEHNGCILVQEKKAPVEGQSGANLSVRTGLRVAITIPGEITRKLEIASFTMEKQDGSRVLRPAVANTGNVSIDADVQVTTRYFFGLAHATHGGQYPVLRGETSEWNFELKRPFWGGPYRTQMTLAYDTSNEAGVGVVSGQAARVLTSDALWFFSLPTLPGLLLELCLLALVGWAVYLGLMKKRRQQWIAASWVPYAVAAGDDLGSLAARRNVSWQLLAKVNDLKPPYALKEGDRLRLPPADK